jgi:hypothetical protein
MAPRKKGTFAKAQSALLKALRGFQTAVSEMTGTSSGEEAGRPKRRKKSKRKTKAKRR